MKKRTILQAVTITVMFALVWAGVALAAVAQEPNSPDCHNSIIINKVTEPAGGTDFGFTLKWGSTTKTFSLNDLGSKTYSPNSWSVFTLTETPKTGYTLKNISCTGPTNAMFTYDLANYKVTIDLDTYNVDGTVTCTFTNVKDMDYGDLNENPAAGPAYGITTFGNDGGRHEVVEGSVRLGGGADIEGDGQPTVNASGDGSDEDGVVRGLTTWGGGSGQVIVTVTDPDEVGDPGDPAAGCLMGWLDYYNETTGELEPDGVFTESFTFGGNTYSEKIIDNLYVPAGVNTINFALPPINVGSNWFMFARFRLSPFNAGLGWDEASGKCNQAAAGLSGLVQGGEIEDYGWLFGPTSVELQSFRADTIKQWGGYEWLVSGLALALMILLWSILRKAHG
jgi:hypothetical protein